ncbi:L-serine dehydratase, partial [Lachnellula arida]
SLPLLQLKTPGKNDIKQSPWDPTLTSPQNPGSKPLSSAHLPSPEKQMQRLPQTRKPSAFRLLQIPRRRQSNEQSHSPPRPLTPHPLLLFIRRQRRLACATAAISLQRPATIVVPLSTSPLMISKLRTLGADVQQVGNHWSESDAYMREELLGGDKDGVYVPPFDHADVWEGNGTLVDEVERQMCGYGGYDAVVASVGGGGLFAGIMAGLSKHGRLEGGGLKGVKVMAVETEGAHSLALSLERGELSRLDAITSIATSLGATQVANQAFEWAKRKEVTSCVFSDAEAAMGAVCFADDERIVVEAACGVSLAVAYNDTLHTVLFPDISDDEFSKLNVVLVVCGGSNITLEILEKYKQEYARDERVVQKFHSRRLASETLKKVS